MIQDRIEKIEATLQAAAHLTPATRDELLRLLGELKAEVGGLNESHPEDADSITRFAGASFHEATRSSRKPEQTEAALKGLTSSVAEFQTSHPRLAEAVDRLATALSNMGI